MLKILKFCGLVLILLTFIIIPNTKNTHALETSSEHNIKAEVLNILNEGYQFIPGTEIETFHQTLEVKILEGEMEGKKVELESEFYKLKEKDKIFINVLKEGEDQYRYILDQPDRRLPLLVLFSIFTGTILFFGLWKGFRSLLSLGISFVIILFFLLPKLLEGASPVPTTIFFASLIVALAMYITHGFNKVTHAAFLGTSITLVFVGLLSYFTVSINKLSGFASHEALYLSLQTGGLLDISGLLLGAIIIGILGILDDVSITQSATVRELYRANSKLKIKDVYYRAFSVGREHMVSLVNTLALAYAGASLPLLLLLSKSEENLFILINSEIFATEITRTLVGSIGLILAIPITTILATLFLKPKTKDQVS